MMSKLRYSILILLLGALMALSSIHTLTSINQDIGRHLRLGEIITSTRSVPATNLFSFTHPDQPFLNHHWLGEVFLYWLSGINGVPGLIPIKALILATAFMLALASAWRRDGAYLMGFAGLVAWGVMLERTDVRPEIFSYLFMGWFLFVLLRYPRSSLRWTLPLVQAVWVNTHITFFMGPLIYLCIVMGDVVRAFPLWRESVRQWLPLGIALALALLVNPWGLSGALYPLQIMSGYGYSVLENKGPFFLLAWGYPMITTVMLFVLASCVCIYSLIAGSRVRHVVGPVALAVITFIFAQIMIRNYAIFGLAGIAALGALAQQHPVRLRQGFWISGVLIILIGISVISGQFFPLARLPQQFGVHVPVGAQAAVDFIRAHELKGPLFNNFDIGSFLIWKLPEEKVFVDGRPEAYPSDFASSVYIPMQENAAVWEEERARWNIQMIVWSHRDLTPWSRTFLERMASDTRWKEVFRDSSTLILIPQEIARAKGL
ncbi:MAG: hypothetical protein QY311_01200 [Candidatus Paceibacterota bacterium]|nr:MAG: hypothetical protein QY311_01200 [Candidatus Paceibacterota bacterium]